MPGMPMLFDLSETIAVVVGGTGTLGGALASALARAGSKVAILGRSEDRGSARVAEIAEAGGAALFQSADALDRPSLETARRQIEMAWGSSPTILVNAAGGNRPGATLTPGGRFEELSLDAWREVFDLNLVGGTLLPSQVFGPPMADCAGGSIINIASMAGMTPLSRVAAYSAAKAAVLNLTQFLAREWAPDRIRVNAISPGFFPAEQNRRLLQNEDGTLTERGNSIISHTPMQRFGEAHELAGAAIWLASARASSFVTGQNIVIDGGFSSVSI